MLALATATMSAPAWTVRLPGRPRRHPADTT